MSNVSIVDSPCRITTNFGTIDVEPQEDDFIYSFTDVSETQETIIETETEKYFKIRRYGIYV